MFRSFSPERESSSSLHQLAGYNSAGSTGFTFPIFLHLFRKSPFSRRPFWNLCSCFLIASLRSHTFLFFLVIPLMGRSGFSLQCNDFLPGKDRSVFSSSSSTSTSSSSSSEYEAESVASTFVSPSLVHMTVTRPKPPARRPPSLKGKRKQAEAKDETHTQVCSDSESVKSYAGNNLNMAEEASKVSLQAIPKAMETSSEDEEGEEESPFLGRDMLEGEEQNAHLSGEGVRQRFFRTRVIPSLDEDEEEEDIILGRSSTTSLLDSILSTIDMSGLSQPVSFPELGRDLIPFWQDEFNPVTNLR